MLREDDAGAPTTPSGETVEELVSRARASGLSVSSPRPPCRRSPACRGSPCTGSSRRA
ncbi:hypothetical protein O1L60_26880 [Streptomyces diastatochromogenes]|nr:hypothetical protein [Streptomyces diastatochromogenes]